MLWLCPTGNEKSCNRVQESESRKQLIHQYREFYLENRTVSIILSAEARGRSATRESVGVQYRDPAPISDAEWREIQLGWEESDDSDIDDEDGDLYLEEWDDY